MSDVSVVVDSQTPVSRNVRDGVDRWFYVGVAVFVAALNVISFGPSIIDPSDRTVPLPFPPLLALHAAVSSAWVILLLVQTTLVATNRTSLHRRVGIAGVLLSIAFVVTTPLVLIEQARRGFDLSGDLVPRGTTQEAAVILPTLSAVLLFALLVGGALWYRHRPDIHKRLMLFAALGPLSGAPLAHLSGHWEVLRPLAIPIAIFGGIALLAILPAYERLFLGRVHRVSLWSAIGITVWNPIFFALIPATTAWRDFTHLLVR